MLMETTFKGCALSRTTYHGGQDCPPHVDEIYTTEPSNNIADSLINSLQSQLGVDVLISINMIIDVISKC